MNMKKITIGLFAAVAVSIGLASAASAAVCDAFGNCVCIWHAVWIQTGPFTGYWTQVCS